MKTNIFCILIALTSISCASSSKKICADRVEFAEPAKIDFNKNEELFICGDPEHESWKDIPLSQSEYHLKTFLSHRAYYTPKFEYKDKKLIVDPGKHLKASKLTFTGDPEHFQDVRIRKVVGESLTTELLNSVEAWTQQRLKNMGYACPEVKITAIQETGEVQVKITPGPQYVFDRPQLTDTIGLYPEAIRRYDAFSKGDPYHYDWVKLTENRAENDGIVVSSQFLLSCPQKNPELEMRHQIMGGSKRLLTIGAGASTEEIPIAQASWKNVRMDENGSSLLVQLYGSHRTQRAKGTFSYFAFKNAPRMHWAPTLRFERRNERVFSSSTAEAAAPLSYQADYQENSLKLEAGPAMKRDFSEEFGIKKAVTFFSLIGDLNFITHNFELYQGDPRSGSTMSLNLEILFESLKFINRGVVIKFSGTHLAQLNKVFPHQWILGFRYGAKTTVSREDASKNSFLPAQYFHTLGGDEDLRGFGRDEISPNGVGGLTSVYGGTELRFAKSLPAGFEPFAFFDLGALGNHAAALDHTLYYSPGLGMRWATPFGALRSTLAHGYVTPSPEENSKTEHLQFFLSFGKEF